MKRNCCIHTHTDIYIDTRTHTYIYIYLTILQPDEGGPKKGRQEIRKEGRVKLKESGGTRSLERPTFLLSLAFLLLFVLQIDTEAASVLQHHGNVEAPHCPHPMHQNAALQGTQGNLSRGICTSIQSTWHASGAPRLHRGSQALTLPSSTDAKTVQPRLFADAKAKHTNKVPR